MELVFKDLAMDEYGETFWAIKILDKPSPIAIAEYFPDKKELWMPKNAPIDVLKHEAHHLLFDYFRDLYKSMGIWPYDMLKEEPSGWDEHFAISMYDHIVETLIKEWGHGNA